MNKKTNQNSQFVMYKMLVIILFVTLCFIIASIFFNSSQDSFTKTKINNIELDLELAQTREEQIRGLSNREELPEKSGLLFVFDKPKNIKIWMKDMKFSIDVLWIDENREVIHIVENMLPETYRSEDDAESFGTDQNSKYILETNSGIVASSGIEVGDNITLE